MEDISALWKCQETQSHAGINNILKLLSEVSADGFNQVQFEHVQQLVRDVSRGFLWSESLEKMQIHP